MFVSESILRSTWNEHFVAIKKLGDTCLWWAYTIEMLCTVVTCTCCKDEISLGSGSNLNQTRLWLSLTLSLRIKCPLLVFANHQVTYKYSSQGLHFTSINNRVNTTCTKKDLPYGVYLHYFCSITFLGRSISHFCNLIQPGSCYSDGDS